MSEQDPKAVAQSQGTRVWNQWDDETAKEIAEYSEDLDHADPHVARTTLNDPPVVETVDTPPAPKPKRQSKPKNK